MLRPGLGNNEKAPMGMRVLHPMLIFSLDFRAWSSNHITTSYNCISSLYMRTQVKEKLVQDQYNKSIVTLL